ncbi:hypothetical protein F5883DRAFT_641059 [Diaporthe sp. PMI_573]|nr:hypothetical protein F5883DRAFT_641059 [Diaporthaceae sp. PMI_573]
MRTSISWHAAIANLLQEAAQGHTRPATPLPGYGIDNIQWSFKHPIGDPVFINGTVQDVANQLEDTEIMQPDSHSQYLRSLMHDQKHSDAKDTMSVKFCGSFPMANSHHTSAQISAIVTASGPAVIGPGPGNCAQRNTTIVLPQGTEELGDAVDAIIDECCVTTQCRVSPNFPISGQAFSNKGWNVIVRADDCE